MSVSSTVTVLRPMAKVVGVSLSLTLDSSFGIGLWESGVRFIKHGLQRDGKVLFNLHICEPW